MKRNTTKPKIRCAIYTRKSTEEGLDQEFNSLDAQRESAEAFIASQKAEGWTCLPEFYDDGGFSGGNIERPAMKRLMADIEAGKIDCVVVYKVDRLSRSLLDFARVMGTFDEHNVAFVSVTQQFNTATPMGRLVLNVLLSFAQFEREIIGERIRDKIAAQRRKGKWTGGTPILGYDVDRSGPSPKLAVNAAEAAQVREIFALYLRQGSLLPVVEESAKRGWKNKSWRTKAGKPMGGRAMAAGKSATRCRRHSVTRYWASMWNRAIRCKLRTTCNGSWIQISRIPPIRLMGSPVCVSSKSIGFPTTKNGESTCKPVFPKTRVQ